MLWGTGKRGAHLLESFSFASIRSFSRSHHVNLNIAQMPPSTSELFNMPMSESNYYLRNESSMEYSQIE